MSFSISNTSASAVITKLSTPSSVTGELTITDGSLPLVVGDLISGTNTEITNTKGSQYGTIQMFLQQGDAKIDTYVNNTLYSTDNYSSGLISVQTPILESSDSLTMSVSDPSFDCYSIGGFSGGTGVSVILEQPDGKILCGGSFTGYSGVSAARIIRLNADFSIDTTFNYGLGLTNTSNVFRLQSDGKILVGGFFSGYNGTLASRIVRLNADGTRDTSFEIGTGFSGGNGVNDILIQEDGKILVSGSFTSYSGDTNYPRIIRLLPTGEIDTTFASLATNNGIVNKIALQSDGKIILGGSFTEMSGETRQGLIRLSADGIIDDTFPTSGVTSLVQISSLIVDEDDKIMISGPFTSFSGVSLNRIARLNSDGTYDDSFVIGSGFTNGASTYITLTNNKYLCTGLFSGYNGNLVASMVRLNYDGSIDTTFNQGTGLSITSVSTSVASTVLSNGNYFIAGPFNAYNGNSTRNGIVVDPFGKLLNCV